MKVETRLNHLEQKEKQLIGYTIPQTKILPSQNTLPRRLYQSRKIEQFEQYLTAPRLSRRNHSTTDVSSIRRYNKLPCISIAKTKRRSQSKHAEYPSSTKTYCPMEIPEDRKSNQSQGSLLETPRHGSEDLSILTTRHQSLRGKTPKAGRRSRVFKTQSVPAARVRRSVRKARQDFDVGFPTDYRIAGKSFRKSNFKAENVMYKNIST